MTEDEQGEAVKILIELAVDTHRDRDALAEWERRDLLDRLAEIDSANED